jgi:hypothetical protein
MLTFANNNLSGNVIYGVVNIYGDLEGDIILPLEQFNGVTAANSSNGSGSNNNSLVSITSNDATFQNNDLSITNNIIFDAQTGNNDVSRNTGGNSQVNTGNASVDANILNIANSNVDGGVWWLVIVNEAGNWVGRLLGAPEGQNYAGSDGTIFTVGPNGEITAQNNGNGSNSTNNASVTTTTNNTTVQNNNAKIENTLNLTANTGGNNANDNTGGSSSIITGDANIIANLINFANNNFIGGGKLIVTVVNVFGSWIGDFVTPGQSKQHKDSPASPIAQNVGGLPSQSTSSNQESKNDSDASSQSNQGSVDASLSLSQVDNKTGNNPQTFFHERTGNSTESIELANKQNTNLAAVLGKSITEDQVARKKIKINLAWLILFAPFFLIALKRRAIVNKLLSLKK